jgi:integrase
MPTNPQDFPLQMAGRAICPDDQLVRILKLADNDPKRNDLRDISRIVINTGLRSLEFTELRWSAVEFENLRIVVQGPKNYRDVRLMPFRSRTLQAFNALRERRPDCEFVLGAGPRNLLLRIARQLKSVGSQIGHCQLSLSALHSTSVSRVLISGADVRTVMRCFGYSISDWPRSITSTEQDC